MAEGLQLLPDGHLLAHRAVPFLARASSALGVLTAGVATAAVASRYIDSASHIVLVLASGVAILTPAAILATAVMAAFRHWILLAVNALLALMLVVTQLPAYWTDGPRIDTEHSLRVLSGNLKLGQAGAEKVVQIAASHHADLVALQEVTAAETGRLKAAGLDRLYPYSIVRSGSDASGVGLWSKYPLTNAENHEGFTFWLVSAVIDVDGRQVTVFSSHLAGPWPQSSANWHRDIRALGELLKATPGPIIDAGDFNATPDNKQFRELLSVSSTADAADQSGSAPVFSYPTDRRLLPPLIAIDHVLLRSLAGRRVYTVTLPGSDHRGLISEVGFPVRRS